MTRPVDRAATVHATVVLVGGDGILIRGVSGSGKSTLARRLLDRAEREGGFARLVADDRVKLSVSGGRLVARPVPAIAGLLEIRGIGIVQVPYEPACVVRSVLDLAVEQPGRYPAEEDQIATVLGVVLPRLAMTLAEAEQHGGFVARMTRP
ncbi:HPr kinase/phosphorylase [uncultured Enterovirga sp.]|uniref:HPr kinase/phosphorylase n=1 Tax=uncultured Enterovirga sp. TaxID=2026352 RepID=UPI0035CC3D77